MAGVDLPPINTHHANDEDMDRRFQGLSRLYGSEGAVKIQQSHVVVVGIGGVGSWAAEALARSGVSRITLIDMDHIAESNVNRQIHALTATIGQSKVLAMRDRIAQINSLCKVDAIDDFVSHENWHRLLPVDAHAVIDACDDPKAKIALAASVLNTPKKPVDFITVGAAGGKRMAHLVAIEDMSAVTHDPLLAKLRYTLRRQYGAAKEKKIMGITCVFSREPVVVPSVCQSGEPVDGGLNCHGYGSAVSVTATFGLCAAGWILNKISTKK